MKAGIAAFTLFIAVAVAAGPPVDFLVPGISLASVDLAPGARVAYLVVSRSFGSSDSSYVELAVTSRGGGEVRLEVSTAPYPPQREETLTIRLRLRDRVKDIESAAAFRACLREIRVREGTGRFREPTEEEIDEFGIEDLFIRRAADAERRPLPEETVSTAAGSFRAAGFETSNRSARTVTLGGVLAERVEEEITRIRVSDEVPLWGLVTSRMERRNEIRRSGSPAGTPRVTITESTLLSFERPCEK